MFLYTKNELSKREIKKTISLKIAPQNSKMLKNKFNQGGKK